jgi:hypothetical protein
VRTTALLIALALSILPAQAASKDWQMKQRTRAEMVALRNLIHKQLFKLEATNNWLEDNAESTVHPEWYQSSYAAIVEDAHRLYMDAEVLAAKLGAKPVSREILELRRGHLYAWQRRDSAEADGYVSDEDRNEK